MNRASAFGRAGYVACKSSYTALSYEIYDANPQDVDVDAIADRDTRKYTPFTPLAGTHMYASFGHLAGYSSTYYTYMWDKVIAEDFFEQFDSKNLLAGDTRHALPAHGAGAGRLGVGERPGEELPRPPAVNGGTAALDGRGIHRRTALNGRYSPPYTSHAGLSAPPSRGC